MLIRDVGDGAVAIVVFLGVDDGGAFVVDEVVDAGVAAFPFDWGVGFPGFVSDQGATLEIESAREQTYLKMISLFCRSFVGSHLQLFLCG